MHPRYISIFQYFGENTSDGIRNNLPPLESIFPKSLSYPRNIIEENGANFSRCISEKKKENISRFPGEKVSLSRRS